MARPKKQEMSQVEKDLAEIIARPVDLESSCDDITDVYKPVYNSLGCIVNWAKPRD